MTVERRSGNKVRRYIRYYDYFRNLAEVIGEDT